MKIIDQEQYTVSATKKIETLQQWQQDFIVPATSINQLINALRMDLYVLSHQEIKITPSNFNMFCIHLGAELLRNEENGTKIAEAMLAADNEKQQAAVFILSLLNLPNDQKKLQQLFQQNPITHKPLLQLWAKQNHKVSMNLLQTALNQTSTQASALNYAVWFDYPLSVFNAHYQSTLENSWAPAILGGLMQVDTSALQQLAKAISKATNPKKLLTIAALSADKSLESSVINFCRNNPDTGIYLLAFYGSQASTEALLNYLTIPQHANQAAAAWHWLSDIQLSEHPSIKLIGSEKQTYAAKLPNRDEADDWFSQQTWNENQRYFAGKPIATNNIDQKMKQWSGQANNYCKLLKKLEQKNAAAAQ